MDITRIETIPFFESIQAKSVDNKEIPIGLYLLVPNISHNNYILSNKQTDGKEYEINFRNKIDKENIDNQFARGTSHICHVKNSSKDAVFFNIYFFAGDEIKADLNVLIENNESMKKVGRDYNDITKNCSIELNGEQYFIIQGNYDLDNKDDTDNERNENKIHAKKNAFSILCENKKNIYGINVILTKDINSDSSYAQVTDIRDIKHKNSQINYCLFKGKLIFNNKKEYLSKINQKNFEKILSENNTYLETWREYVRQRGNKILDLAREFGKQNFGKVSRSSRRGGDSTTFLININIRDLIDKLKIYEVVVYKQDTPIPLFLENMNCDFLYYCEDKRMKKKIEKEKQKNKKNKEEIDGVRCEIKSVTDNQLELEPVSDKYKTWLPKENGYIVMSVSGEEAQVNRQEEAWNTIRTGQAGIHHLNYLLEGQFDFISNQTKQKKYKITPRIKRKIFKNEPTDKQLEAIDMALQTPDIALIQGPPGTGKTTVITAILEVLNEAQDKRGVCAGRVLVTAYQHDAVENMIAKIRINSLPTYKYGSRRDKKTYHEHIDEWCKDIEKKVLENNPDIKISNEEEQFYILLSVYKTFPIEENKIKLLDYICTYLPVSSELSAKARNIRFNNKNASKNNMEDILKKAYSLRTTENSFKDDGKKRIEELYFLLDGISYFDENEDLKNLFLGVINSKEINEDLIKVSKNIQEQIIKDEKFDNKPQYVKEEVDDNIINLCKDIEKFLDEHRSKTSKVNSVIVEWIKTLRAGSAAFVSAIKECDFVYSATTQQTEGKDIREQKSFIENIKSDYLNRYDTVIIDEAARATPPDLLIPMCKALKRIILVGDHRQLPQLVDEDICNEAIDVLKKKKVEEGKENFDFESAYKLSLFENLFNKLKDLEKKDGIKRIITLDTQYRTHPLLGEFASKEFYEIYSGERYLSPRKAEEFKHNLPGIENKAAVWIDIPGGKGKEEKNMHPSYQRICEADIIVDNLERFIESQKILPKEERYSYGIITFYKAQETLIENKIKNKIKNNKNFENFKIEIGTVDSFQGKEFDVVFLSVVRTNSKNEYGFLTSVNRMCVSMTRQKKALIVVGDKNFVTTEKARKTSSISSLANFYDLCKSNNEYGVVL